MSQDTISLTVEPREVTGKSVKQLRANGTIPAVIHDHGKESVVVQGNAVQMIKVWQQAGKHHPVALTAGDKKYVALIKDASFDPKKHLLTHLVFNAVDKNQKVEAEVPVRPRYDEGNESSPAERAGFIVLSQLETVQVKALADKLPDFLEYDAEKLVEVGDSITVADIFAQDGVEIETVYEPSALAAANDAAGGDAEPGDEANVESDTESSAEEGNQAAEDRPGGKGQDEPKPSSVEAAKEDK